MGVAKPRNNYDFIRLVASCLVIIGHAYVLLAVPGVPVVFQVSISTFAVEVFFALSGYLVVKSWLNDPDLMRFVLKRGLRIVPGLVGVVMFSALLLGPLVTEYSYVDYFSHPLLPLYFLNIVFYIVHSLPGVFTENIYPNAVNGSLWSLPVEVGMYALVLFTGLVAKSYFRAAWLLLTVASLGLNYAIFVLQSPITDTLIVYGTGMKSVVQIGPYFMVGGCICLFKGWVPFRPLLTLAVLAVAWYLTTTGWPLAGIGLIVTVTYVVISFGSYATPVLRDFGRFGDMSYGVYLYGFPVAQCFSLAFGNTIPVEVQIIFTIGLTLVLAFFSWHLIEVRALRFKPSRSAAPFWALGRKIGDENGAYLAAPHANGDRVGAAKTSVAVLMCTYNGARFLTEQMESILRQDHGNFRIFVSDDGSTDGTNAILEAYQTRLGQERLTILRGPGEGFAANFLSLLRQPQIEADCYAFADQDDIWEENKLRNAVSLIAREPAGLPVVYASRSRLVDVGNVEIGLSSDFRRPPSFRNAIIQSIGGGNTMFIDRWARDLACRAEPRPVVSHDWWLYMLVTGAGGKMIFDPFPGVRYRQHDGNLVGMNVGWKMKLQRLKMLFSGEFRQWIDVNISALEQNEHLLTPENRGVLAEFSSARRGGPLKRLAGIWRSGAYRQSVADEIVIFCAILARRV